MQVRILPMGHGCTYMSDRDFLIWLSERLVNVYKEDRGTDFVLRLRSIALRRGVDLSFDHEDENGDEDK